MDLKVVARSKPVVSYYWSKFQAFFLKTHLGNPQAFIDAT